MTGPRQPGETHRQYRERVRGRPDPTHDVVVPWPVLNAALEALQDVAKLLRARDEQRAAAALEMPGAWLPAEQRSPLTRAVEDAAEPLGAVLAADYRARHPEQDRA